MGGLLIAAWVLLAIATAWWLLLRHLDMVPHETSGPADPDAAKIRDFLRAFSEWDHGGRPG
jgi:hypothetical protein